MIYNNQKFIINFRNQVKLTSRIKEVFQRVVLPEFLLVNQVLLVPLLLLM